MILYWGRWDLTKYTKRIFSYPLLRGALGLNLGNKGSPLTKKGGNSNISINGK
jgi:hypothetical protein